MTKRSVDRLSCRRFTAASIGTAIGSVTGLVVLVASPAAAAESAQAIPDSLMPIHFWLRWALAAALLGVFGWLFWQALGRFLASMDQPEPGRGAFWVESRWGGLGGGLGGWRVSNALVYLMLLAILGGLMLAAGTFIPSSSRESGKPEQKAAADGSQKKGSEPAKDEKKDDRKDDKKDEPKEDKKKGAEDPSGGGKDSDTGKKQEPRKTTGATENAKPQSQKRSAGGADGRRVGEQGARVQCPPAPPPEQSSVKSSDCPKSE